MYTTTRRKEQQILNVHMLSKQNRSPAVQVKTHLNPGKSAEFIHSAPNTNYMHAANELQLPKVHKPF